MNDPTIAKSSVTIRYTGSDGFHSEDAFANFDHTPLLFAFEELSRLLHLFGFGEEAMQYAKEAADRVATWKASR